ncbi:hypothetical protein JAAARDRAFT_141370, partial [Jaapia argillacea MUCL 33604]
LLSWKEATHEFELLGKYQINRQIWATVVSGWVVQVIMQFRIYAMYNRSRRILFFMVSCFLMEVAAAMAFALYQDAEGINSPLLVVVQMGSWTGCLVTKPPRFSYGTWASILAFEGILFLFALYKTVLHLMRLRAHWTRDNVTDVLLRDNMFYFLVCVLPHLRFL